MINGDAGNDHLLDGELSVKIFHEYNVQIQMRTPTIRYTGDV